MVTASEIIGIMVENELNIDTDKLDHDEPLKNQGVDSLDMTTILFALEEQFKIRIPEEDIEQGKLSSINAILTYVNNLI